MKRVWRTLRSRKVAIWVLIAVIVYAAAATTVSDGDWGVPYRNPVFLLLAAFLSASTAACAWERTRASFKGTRLSPLSEAQRTRLRDHAHLSIPLARSADDPVALAESALRDMRLRTMRHEDGIDARSGIIGAFGSPVFHWALALLFVAVGAGQLTRVEGLMGIVSGSSRVDVLESYGAVDTGPLGSFTGRVIAVGDMPSNYVVNGIDRGVTPYVEIRSEDGETVLASGYAYPNHPIRYRSMLIHNNNDGLGAVVEVSGGGQSFTEQLLLDYDETGARVEPALFGLNTSSGEPLQMVALEPAEGSTPEAPTVRIRVAAQGGSPLEDPQIDVVAAEGETLELLGGLSLRIVSLAKYARLSVVNDVSVYPIYALFGMALIGLVLALFAPLRGVRVLLVESEEGKVLHAAVRHSRGDPHFPDRVKAALVSACGQREGR